MEKQQDISNLVDLFTFNRELESIMLSDYPGKIKESQCSIDETGMDGKKLYRFYDLDKQTLLNFLAGKKYEYEIRNSKAGEIVKIKTFPRQYIPSSN